MHRSGRSRAVLASLSLLSVTLLTAAPVAAKPDKGRSETTSTSS